MNILKALKRSPLGLDLYLWLTYRTFALTSPLRLAWTQPLPPVRIGSGARLGTISPFKIFRKDCLRELKKIKIAWPALNYATAKGVLIIYPSAPSILPAQRRLLE